MLLEQNADGLLQLDVGGRVEGVLRVHAQGAIHARHLVHVDAVERPTVRGRDLSDLLLRLRERDVENTFAVLLAFAQELECERGLSDAWCSLQEVEPARREAASEHVIEAGDACRGTRADHHPLSLTTAYRTGKRRRAARALAAREAVHLTRSASGRRPAPPARPSRAARSRRSPRRAPRGDRSRCSVPRRREERRRRRSRAVRSPRRD